MEIKTIEELVGMFKDSRISELSVTTGAEEKTTIRLRKELAQPAMQHRIPPSREHPSSVETQPAYTAPEPDTSAYVVSPKVGIFHSIDSVGVVGAEIRTGQVLGSIESMKLMNDVISKYDGIIEEILIEDGMPVEYGQALFMVRLG
jgi:acetyl-CoA carboxylase biotin carboxyl carrier protein